jgi:hypothetical protein
MTRVLLKVLPFTRALVVPALPPAAGGNMFRCAIVCAAAPVKGTALGHETKHKKSSCNMAAMKWILSSNLAGKIRGASCDGATAALLGRPKVS